MKTNLSEIAKTLGKRGGNKTKKRGKVYYQEIGRKGGSRPKKKKEVK